MSISTLLKLSLATVGSAVVALGMGGAAKAASFTEVESNNTFGTAQLLTPHDGTISVAGSRVGDSSADFFRFFATAGDVISLAVNTPGGPFFSNDPVLGLFNSLGTQIAVDDDGGPGYDSLISGLTIGSTGFYTAAVSGFSDFGFTGGGSSGWNYQLEVTGLTPESVPEPASTLGLLAFGAMGVGAMQKRKKQAIAEK